MKRLLFTIIIIFITTLVSSQCLSGDCENGFGKIQFSDGSTYEGTFENKLPNGLGIAAYTNGTYYLGQFVNSKFNGYGFLQNPDGQNFIGQWENSLQNGEGVFTDTANNINAGVWENSVFKNAISIEAHPKNASGCVGNCFDGYGRIMESKNTIQAIFKNGNPTFGRIFNRAKYTYDGQIENGLPNGYGQIKYNDGEHYFGYFKDGQKHGIGILSNGNQPKVYGTWENDIYMPFNILDFCNEINSLPSHVQIFYYDSSSVDAAYLGKKMKKKFLAYYEINVIENKLNFITSYDTRVSFPNNNESVPKITLKQLNYALEHCDNITKINESKYKYKINMVANTIETYQDNSGVFIRISYDYN